MKLFDNKFQKFRHSGKLVIFLSINSISHIFGNMLLPVHVYCDDLVSFYHLESHLTKFTMILKIDVSISEDLSSSTGYSTVESKVHIAVSITPLNIYISIYPSIYLFIYLQLNLYNYS